MARATKKNVSRRVAFITSVVLILGCLGIFFPSEIFAAQGSGVTAQFRLRDGSGSPYTSPLVVRFSIYGVKTKAITTSSLETAPLLWQETHAGGANCPLIYPDSQGSFSVNLGSCVPFPNSFKGSAVVFDMKVGPEPGKALMYDVVLDEAETPTKPATVWIRNHFIPFQALRGSLQLNLKTKELLPSTDDSVTASPDALLTDSSSTPSVSTDDLTLALQFLESRLSAVTSTFIQASASSTVVLLQNAVLPSLNVANLTVSESPTFNGNLVVQGTVGFGVDTIGQAKILAGFTTVNIPFAKPYDRAPLVVVTPLNYDGLWKLPFVTTTGFALRLSATSTDDILFSWYAFMPSVEAHIVVSQPEDQSTTIKVLPQSHELVHSLPPVPDEPQTSPSTTIVASTTQPTELVITTPESPSSTDEALTTSTTSTISPISIPTSSVEQSVIETSTSAVPDVSAPPSTSQSSSI